MKSNYIIRTNISENCGILKICLLIILMSGSIDQGWILMSASAFNWLQYAALVEVYEENPDLNICIVKKGRHFW